MALVRWTTIVVSAEKYLFDIDTSVCIAL